MSTSLKAAALAAIAFIAAPAEAATIYTFTVSGQGTTFTRPFASAPFEDYRFRTFTDAVVTIADNFNFFNTPPQANAPFQGGNLDFSATATRLFISLTNGSGQRGVTGAANVEACGAFGGTLPTSNVAIDPSCGSVTVNFSGNETGTQFSGKVSGLTVTTVQDYFSSPFTFALAVPEPSTWAMMLTGFALTGYALRRRRARIAFA